MRYVVRVSLVLLFVSALFGMAHAVNHAYPKVANIFTSKPTPDEIAVLSKWDLVCLGTDIQDNCPEVIADLRSRNPDIVIIAYFPAGFVWDNWHDLGQTAYNYGLKVQQTNWWLRDNYGNRVGKDGYLWFTNLATVSRSDYSGRIFASWLADYIVNQILSTGLWDGILIDGLFENATWINNNDQFFTNPSAAIDANGDGVADQPESLYVWWRDGVRMLLSTIRARVGYSYIVIANGKNYQSQFLNGGIREDFPHMHGDWNANMFSDFGYVTMCRNWSHNPMNCPLILCYYDDPQNTLYEPNRTMSYERFLRFTLTSALLGDGYYFMEGRQGDALWWEDYYDLDLGNPLGDACLDSIWSDVYRKYYPVWVREFENATIYCNPVNQWIPFEDGTWLGPQDGRIVQHSEPSFLLLDASMSSEGRTFTQKDRGIRYSVEIKNDTEHSTYFSLWSRLTQHGDTVAYGACRNFLIGAKDTLKTDVFLRFLEPPSPGLYCLEVFLGRSHLVPVCHDTLYLRRIVDFEKRMHINDDSGEGEVLTIYPQPSVSSLGDIRMEVNLDDLKSERGRVEIYDVRGRRILSIDNLEFEDGHAYNLGADLRGGASLAPGIYYLTITLGEKKITQKIVLLSH